MTRVKVFAGAGAGLVFAAVGWCLAASQDTLTAISAAWLGRSAGLAMLGFAMLATGLVFRWAMAAPKAPTLQARLATSEFRRGFGNKVTRAKAMPRQPTQREVIVALRRAVAAQAGEPTAAPIGTILPAREAQGLQQLLHSRAAQLYACNADEASRRLPRGGIDVQGWTTH
jgi:hypothetical protein